MQVTLTKDNANEAGRLLLALYRHRSLAPGGLLTLFFTRGAEPNKKREAESYRLTTEARSFHDPVLSAMRRTLAGWDVYFNLALHNRRPDPGKRGDESHAGACFFTFLDIDVGQVGHKGGSLCPSVEAAQEILKFIPPTAIVRSGGGLHAYWLLEAPLVLSSEEDRRRAKDFLRRFQSAFRTPAVNPQGYKIDDTADLARVLRLPGTLNWKRTEEPRPVTIMSLDPENEWPLDSLEAVLDMVLPEEEQERQKEPPQPTPPTLLWKGAMTPGVSLGSSNLTAQTSPPTRPTSASRLRKARLYAAKFEPGITGTALGRHQYGFKKVLAMIGDPFHLQDHEALEVLREWASRCVPPFTERELLEMMGAHRRWQGSVRGG